MNEHKYIKCGHLPPIQLIDIQHVAVNEDDVRITTSSKGDIVWKANNVAEAFEIKLNVLKAIENIKEYIDVSPEPSVVVEQKEAENVDESGTKEASKVLKPKGGNRKSKV